MAQSKRPTTRRLLASAIEYVAEQKLRPLEHERFFVEHYVDPVMEDARAAAVSVLTGCGGVRHLPRGARRDLRKIASDLRAVGPQREARGSTGP
jgi:hypothetical protein